MALGWFERLIGRGASPSETPAPQTNVQDPGSNADPAGLEAAIALHGIGRFQESSEALQAIIADAPSSARAQYYLGLCELRLQRYEAAVDALVLATHFDPDSVDTHYALAAAEQRLGRSDDALASVDRAIALGGITAKTSNLRGSLLTDANRIDEAIACFEQTLSIDPDNTLAHSNLGSLLFNDRGECERGAYHLERAMTLEPTNTTVLSNYTMVLLAHKQDLAGTIETCDRLLEVRPDLHEAMLNRGIARLKTAQFANGWDDYEARKFVRGNFAPRGLSLPEWDGSDLRGNTLLIYAEQGLGDEIMFASCFDEMIERAGRCIIECSPRLHALFARSFPRAEVVAGSLKSHAVAARGIDIQCAAGSLPKFLRRSWSEFPTRDRYLQPNVAAVSAWQQKLDHLGPGLKVGLSWRGGAVSTRRTLRSIDLALLTPLLQRADCHFVDLQYGETRLEREEFERSHAARLTHWPEAIDDLDAGAALIAALDIVISVCTTAAHMSGALGCPIWTLVPSNAEWRYLNAGERMAWYPSARLFRQRDAGSWDDVIADVAAALSQSIRMT